MSLDLGTSASALAVFEDADGVQAPSQHGGVGGFLSDVIVDLGFADRALVEDTVNEGRQAGKAAVALLLERGELSTEQLARAIAERNGLPFVDLRTFKVDETARQLIDRGAGLRYRAVPIAFAPDGSLVTALADPLDTLAVSDIAVMTKSDLVPVVADSAQIERLVEELPKHRQSNDFLFADEPASPPSAAAGAAAPPLALVGSDLAVPAPAGAGATSALPARLEQRVLELVRAALADVANSEVERLEHELAAARREIERLSGESAPSAS